jgi:Protein of unknown function (DUF2897)
MTTAIIAIVLVLGLIGGLIFTLKTTAKTGLPPKDVAARATQRSRELDAQEKSADEKNL